MEKKVSSDDWKKSKVILKIALVIGAISGLLYTISNGFDLKFIKNGFILGIFMVIIVAYFGSGLFANNQSQ